MTPRIEPVTPIDGRLFDRRGEGQGREPREQPKDTFTRVLQEAQEQEDGRPHFGGT
jgi:hypothetical protein